MFKAAASGRGPWRPPGAAASTLKRGAAAAVAGLALLAVCAAVAASWSAPAPARTDAYGYAAASHFSAREARGVTVGAPAACPGVGLHAPATLQALCLHQEQFVAAARVATGQLPRYFVVAPRGGLGNKIRAIAGAIKAALATGRQLVIDDSAFPWYHRFFTSPLKRLFVSEYARGGGNASVAALVPASLKDADPSRFAVLTTEKAPAWQCLRNGTFDACVGGAPVVYASAHYGVGHHADAYAPASYALALAGVPLTRFGYGAQVVRALFSTPSEAFAARVAAKKAELGWDDPAWELRVGFHLRVCLDCGAPNRIAATTDPRFGGLLACAKGWLQGWVNGSAPTAPLGSVRTRDPARVLVYVATDDATFLPAVSEALAGLAVVRSLAPDARSPHFVNTRDMEGSQTDPVPSSDLEAPLLDWWLLGEADVMLGTGSTFGTYAALRRPIPAVLAKPVSGKEAAAAVKSKVASLPPAVCGWEAGHHAWVKAPDVAL